MYVLIMFFTYIMTNLDGSVRYIGQGDDLLNRVWEHQAGIGSRFTALHDCNRLVWLESHSDRLSAFLREQELHEYDRAQIGALIARLNPDGADLSMRLSVPDLLKPVYRYDPECLNLCEQGVSTPDFTPHLAANSDGFRLAG